VTASVKHKYGEKLMILSVITTQCDKPIAPIAPLHPLCMGI
jgi:hypothetical protein